MGCYNYFEGSCPNCGQPFEAQTKLTGGEFETHEAGGAVPLEDMDLQLKEGCYCGLHPVAVIRGGKLVGFRREGATAVEGAFGTMMLTGRVLVPGE